MKRIPAPRFLLVCAIGLVSLLFQVSSVSILGQQQKQNNLPAEPQEPSDDVIRISTDLVQTGVSVYDKRGKFVDGLQKQDFELKVDGKPVDVSFFELIAAGSISEERQPGVAPVNRRVKVEAPTTETILAAPANRGRVIVFFVDDIHISPDSLIRTKKTITKFIDDEMGPNDLVAVASASGQIGFLQQYTTNKEVLKQAVQRLSFRNYGTRDLELPIMTDGQAVLINNGDRAVLGFFVGETMRFLNVRPSQAEEIVRHRAKILVAQSGMYSKSTLSSLETLARRAAGLPGRKLIFFISDGFPIDAKNSDTLDRLRLITDASIRAGVIIYSLDARGLVTDMMDATVENPPSGYVAFATREVGGDVLNSLAQETGGRFIHNTNGLGLEVTKALKETSLYYLLGWRPNEVEAGLKFRRIEIKIKNRPELSVRVQRGYYNQAPETKQKQESAKAATANPLRNAINSLFPKRGVPTRLALNYMETPGAGWTLVTSMKVAADALKFAQQGDKNAAVVDIAGTIYDAKGKALENFSDRLTVPAPSATGAKPAGVIYNHRATLPPGLYQVRVAALDPASGQTGSAAEWVEIPDFSKRGFSMSKLIVAETKANDSPEKPSIEDVTVSVDRKFEKSSNLRFLVYVYNAARAAAGANDVALQVQIFRGNQLVATMPARQPSKESQDPTHLAYAAEIPLRGLSSGQYVLQVTAKDRIANASASQTVRFEVQ